MTASPTTAGMARVQCTVKGAPGGDTTCMLTFVDGELDAAVPQSSGTADLKVSLGAAQQAAIAAGDLRPSVAFMRGDLKIEGDAGLALGFLARSTQEAVARWFDRLASRG